MSQQLPAWARKGIQFECQGSGKCCVSHGEYGHVYLTKSDRKAMAKTLGLSLSDFIQKHCDRKHGLFVLREDRADQACRFLKDKKCEVYAARPTQCRTWPFWPEVMSAKSWKADVASFCPGVGKGRIWTEDEIVREVNAQILSENELVKELKK